MSLYYFDSKNRDKKKSRTKGTALLNKNSAY